MFLIIDLSLSLAGDGLVATFTDFFRYLNVST